MFYATATLSSGTIRFYSFRTEAIRRGWLAVSPDNRETISKNDPSLVKALELKLVKLVV